MLHLEKFYLVVLEAEKSWYRRTRDGCETVNAMCGMQLVISGSTQGIPRVR